MHRKAQSFQQHKWGTGVPSHPESLEVEHGLRVSAFPMQPWLSAQSEGEPGCFSRADQPLSSQAPGAGWQGSGPASERASERGGRFGEARNASRRPPAARGPNGAQRPPGKQRRLRENFPPAPGSGCPRGAGRAHLPSVSRATSAAALAIVPRRLRGALRGGGSGALTFAARGRQRRPACRERGCHLRLRRLCSPLLSRPAALRCAARSAPPLAAPPPRLVGWRVGGGRAAAGAAGTGRRRPSELRLTREVTAATEGRPARLNAPARVSCQAGRILYTEGGQSSEGIPRGGGEGTGEEGFLQRPGAAPWICSLSPPSKMKGGAPPSSSSLALEAERPVRENQEQPGKSCPFLHTCLTCDWAPRNARYLAAASWEASWPFGIWETLGSGWGPDAALPAPTVSPEQKTFWASPKRFSGLIRTGGAPTSGAGSEDGRGKSHRRPSPPLSPLEPSGTRRHGGPVAEESRSRRSEVRRAESNGRRVSARSAAPAAQAGRASGGAASARSSSRQARRPAPRGLRRGGELSGSSGSRLLFPLGRPEDAARLLPEDPARVEAPPGPLPPPQLPAPAMVSAELRRLPLLPGRGSGPVARSGASFLRVRCSGSRRRVLAGDLRGLDGARGRPAAPGEEAVRRRPVAGLGGSRSRRVFLGRGEICSVASLRGRPSPRLGRLWVDGRAAPSWPVQRGLWPALRLQRKGSLPQCGAQPLSDPPPPLSCGVLSLKPFVPPFQQKLPVRGENHLGRCQQEAEEVTEIMLDNYTKVLDREGKLSDLDERADELCKQSSAFTKTTKTLAQKKRWENMRFKIILLAVVVVAVLLIVITLYFTLSGSGNQVAPAKTSTGGD
ncbi:vesicle-associated membrane protein 5 [Crotalus adamanteus]|uniref:Vesicle-associated membrane protein 5 n=1 Tax=Crotalus adamanteus TaxID=8729 RepID=A0AAW1B009_CROAD